MQIYTSMYLLIEIDQFVVTFIIGSGFKNGRRETFIIKLTKLNMWQIFLISLSFGFVSCDTNCPNFANYQHKLEL